jgi:hypothetical protein
MLYMTTETCALRDDGDTRVSVLPLTQCCRNIQIYIYYASG